MSIKFHKVWTTFVIEIDDMSFKFQFVTNYVLLIVSIYHTYMIIFVIHISCLRQEKDIYKQHLLWIIYF